MKQVGGACECLQFDLLAHLRSFINFNQQKDDFWKHDNIIIYYYLKVKRLQKFVQYIKKQ